jgi:hypothetical protein
MKKPFIAPTIEKNESMDKVTLNMGGYGAEQGGGNHKGDNTFAPWDWLRRLLGIGW